VSVLFLLLRGVLSIYMLIMWARLILDFVVVLNRGWRPRGAALVLAELVFTLTDPPLRFVRRFLPPVRFGGMGLDFAWMIVMLGLIVLSYVLEALAR
jgi:YggT family protein